jgi:hypothetical protein
MPDLSNVKTSPEVAAHWRALAVEFENLNDFYRAEVAALGSLYIQPNDGDTQRRWFRLYERNRHDRLKVVLTLKKALQTVAPAIDLVKNDPVRRKEELMILFTYLETGRIYR